MDSKSTNSGKSSRQRRQAAIARKKAILAAVLVLVMVVLWIRLFAKKGKKAAPAKVTAATSRTVTTSNTTVRKPKKNTIKYKQLPMVAGRNDVLQRDIFSKKSWIDAKDTADAWNSKREILSDDIRRAGKSLKLEAILMGEGGEKSEIFIEDKLVPLGADFPTRHAGRIYRFTVEKVTANKVILKCKDVSVVLKLSELEG